MVKDEKETMVVFCIFMIIFLFLLKFSIDFFNQLLN